MKKFYLILFHLVIINEINAQNFLFLDPTASSSFYNPAFTGGDTCTQIRNSTQLQSPGSYSWQFQNFLTVSQYLNKPNAWIGFGHLFDNKADLIHYNQYSLFVAKPVYIKKNIIWTHGLQLSLLHQHYNNGQIFYGDQIDPRIGFVFDSGDNYPNYRSNFFLISYGTSFQYKNLLGGITLHNINHLGKNIAPKLIQFEADKDNKNYQSYLDVQLAYKLKLKIAGGELNTALFSTGTFYVNANPYIKAGLNFEWQQFRIQYSKRITESLDYNPFNSISFGYNGKSAGITYSFGWNNPQLKYGGTHQLSLLLKIRKVNSHADFRCKQNEIFIH